MDNLTNLLNSKFVLTPEMRADVQHSYLQDMFPTNPNLRVIPPMAAASASKIDFDGIKNVNALLDVSTELRPPYPPPERLLCANVQVAAGKVCDKSGNMTCSQCKLVSYCSKECQRLHWRIHKRGCKNILMSEDWRPCWAIEDRPPCFLSPISETILSMSDFFSLSLSLWGNMPAMDIVNLQDNEADSTKDLSLAFIASGDLRNVMRTINALPSDFTGSLKVLINDRDPHAISRNLALLIILGTVPDEALAADMALHFWYSAFQPAEYRSHISTRVLRFLMQVTKFQESPCELTPCSTLSSSLSRETIKILTGYFSSSSMSDVQSEYDRVRNAPSRRDYRDRMYANLRPSHRVAFQEYRRFGILLPFGAVNAHFNEPNISLFSQGGQWLQPDYADPLDGWNLDEIIKAGKAHGAQPEDIYGCLYFFLSDELRSFFRRLRQFHIAFHLTDLDASDLSHAIRDGLLVKQGIPPSIRFDRIEVSNILDDNYIGVRDVLTNWAPLLSESESAAIVGYFMNWTSLQKDGNATNIRDSKIVKALVRSWTKNMKGQHFKPDLVQMMMTTMDDMNALYENSVPFMNFLKKKGIDDILRRTRLNLRDKHTIVSHRLRVPLSAPKDALPEFLDDDSWYYHTRLINTTWTERFVEFSHA